MRPKGWTWISLLVLVFLVAFALRGAAIKLTPRGDYFPDLEIYKAGGDLVLHGINPYDFSAHVAERSALREQAHSPLLHDSQAQWDYYACSNLPLNLLFFGALSAISDTGEFYRYSFAFFDSILSALIVWFVIRHWAQSPGALGSWFRRAGMASDSSVFYERLVVGLMLGCLSPVLFKHGVAYPEDKGIEILLMLSVIACFLSVNDRVWFWEGAVLLGLSIAFKALGIFLVPLFAYRILAASPRPWLRLFVFAVVVLLVTTVWLAPFGLAVESMVKTRLALGSSLIPQHASIWVLPSRYLPRAWTSLRWFTIGVIVGVSAIGYWRKRITVAELCVTLVFTFSVVWLTNGALSRLNMGMLLALLVLGSQRVNAVLICMIPYLLTGLGGSFMRGAMGATFEAGGTLIFTVTYLVVLSWISFSSADAGAKIVDATPS